MAILIITLLLLLLTYLFVDDSKTPFSKELLDYKTIEQLNDNGEVFLWCFACKTNKVYMTAKKIQKQIIQHEKKNFKTEIDWEGMKFYQFDDKSLLCAKFELSCDVLKLTLINLDNNLYAKYNWAIQRYLQYIQFDIFVSQTYPSMNGPTPNYRNITNAQKILHLWLLQQVSVKNIGHIIALIHKELFSLKNILIQSDTLMTEMITVALISENLELVNLLIQKDYVSIDLLKKYGDDLSLTEAHHDLTPALKRDFTLYTDTFSDYVSMNKIIEKNNNIWFNNILYKILMKFVYKQNLTLNTITKKFSEHLLITRLSAREFFDEIPFVQNNDFNKWRNYFGSYLLKSYKTATYEDYTARIHNLHNKMILLKSLINHGTIEQVKKAIESNKIEYKNIFNDDLPYFENNLYCFSSIESDVVKLKDRCLRVL